MNYVMAINHGCEIVNYNILLDKNILRAWIVIWITTPIGDYGDDYEPSNYMTKWSIWDLCAWI